MTRSRGQSRFDRALGFTLGIGFVLLLVFGLVFSIAYGSQQISASAASLHTADEMLRATTVVRAQLAIATHFAVVDQQLGSNSQDEISTSLTEAEQATSDLALGQTILLESQQDRASGVAQSTQAFIKASEAITDYLQASEVDQARVVAAGALPERFDHLVGLIEILRDELATEVQEADILLGRIGTLTRFLVAFMVPVTVMLVYRELLRRQHRQAELENRLETEHQIAQSREEFIANASHELRTPLTGIAGLAYLLKEDPIVQGSESTAEMVDMIIGEASDLGRMVEDLLTAARLDAGAMHYTYEDVNLGEEVIEAIGNVERAGLDVTINCEPALIRVDRMRFRQILRNPLSNAGKYGGPHASVNGIVDGRTYLITVSDDGPGMGPKVAERLFERFTHQGSGTAVHQSVGLGLSIVQALVQGMGGSIHHERSNRHTNFHVRLPLSEQVVDPRGIVEPAVHASSRLLGA